MTSTPSLDEVPAVERRPHLDGMRALAVYLVVAFHAGVDRLAGGFIGVDVFFVLSGFLVTGLLVGDLEGPGRTVRWGRFYSRRARRLLPAAAVNLVVTAVVFTAVAAPVEVAEAERGIQAAALYISNWYFIGESAQYFGADVEASPVLQYWSLSVEEQFYLLWPVLLGGVYWVARRAGRRRALVVRSVIGVAGLASLVAALVLSTRDLERAYYGTDTRAYQLLAGALLAVSPGVVRWVRSSPLARALPALSVGLATGLVVLSTSLVAVNPIGRGAVATVLTVGLITSLDAARGGVGRAVLSWSPIAYLGRISYGTYLWHWLVIVVLAREAEVGPLATLALSAVLSTGLASLSYQVLENPIRTSPTFDRPVRAVIGAGLALSLVVALVVTPRVMDDATGGDVALAPDPGTGARVTSVVPTPEEVAEVFYEPSYYGDCDLSRPAACPLTPGDGQTAIVVGESHAGMLTGMLEEVAGRHDVRLMGAYLQYCPWTRGIQYFNVGQGCLDDQAEVFDRIIPELDPDIVFLAHRPVDDADNRLELRDQDGGLLEGEAARQDGLRRRITALVRSLRADGRTVVMFEPVPAEAADHQPLACLSEASAVEECRFVNPVAPTDEEQVMRDLAAEDPGTVSVDLDPLVCPYLPICDPVVDGLIVKRDDNHLAQGFAATLADPVDEYLTGQGVFGAG